MKVENTIAEKNIIIMIQVNSVSINARPSSIETFHKDVDALTKNWEETDYTSVVPTVLIASTSQDYLNQLEKEFSKTHLSKSNEGLSLIEFKTLMKKTAKSISQKDDQDRASIEEIAEYNKLAKYYNALLKKRDFTIQMSDVRRLEHLYKIMSDEQRQNAESFPDFPPPPPPPPSDTPDTPGFQNANKPETGFIKINGKEHYYVTDSKGTRYYNRYGGLVDKNGKTVIPGQTNASDVIKGQYITKVYKDGKIVSEFSDNRKRQKSSEMLPPPPPPPPPPIPDPVEHMKQMAKTNARFYYEGKQITGKQAIKIAEDNEDINIQIRDTNLRQPYANSRLFCNIYI